MTTYRTARFPDCIARPRSRGARLTGPASPDVVTSWLYPVDRDLMPHQIEAIAAVMQLFVDDDIANGVSPKATRVCDACGQQRPSPGFVRYDERELCNPCATAYEVRRARGLTRSIGVYLDQFRERHGA